MKTHEITTSKGEFVIADYATDCHISQISIGRGETDLAIGFPDGTFKRLPFNYKLICKLSEATEVDAKLIVDKKGDRFQDYNHTLCCDRWCNTALDSLHSLLKSNNITGDNLYIYLIKQNNI